MTNEELACKAQAGSLPSFAKLVERLEERLFNFLIQRTRNHAQAEDLSQEAFIRAWRRIHQYNPQWKFTTWLFTIAARLHMNEQSLARNKRVHQDVQNVSLTAQDHDPSASASDGEQRHTLWSIAEENLKPDQYLVLWLRYAEGMAVKDIAGVLGKTSVTTRVLLFRARNALAEFVDYSPEEGVRRASEQEAADSEPMSNAPTSAPRTATFARESVAGGV